MFPTTAMLAEALDLAREEAQALFDQDVDRADTLSAKRAEILAAVCGALHPHTRNEAEKHLRLLDNAQKDLTTKAGNLLGTLRTQYRHGRRMTGYFNNDRILNRELKKSFYCDAVS
ncbi:MAG: hypothetical protein LBR82_01155 [Desulfovibrio sp.]|jgi:hypothetical protein|nr:hypothetical protein [Desulfovibrio sp.]